MTAHPTDRPDWPDGSTGGAPWEQLLAELGPPPTVSGGDVGAQACAEALGKMFLYLDHELDDPVATQRIAAHLDLCLDCLKEFDVERVVRTVVARSVGGVAAPVALRERIEVELRRAGGEGSGAAGA